MVSRRLESILCIALAWALPAVAAEPPLAGPEAEEFLRSARVVEMKTIGTGVTRPQWVTLAEDGRTARAVWKTVDLYEPIKRFHDRGTTDVGFRDSYKHEIAAYELDKLLQMGMTPVTVVRRIGRDRGSLQLALEEVMSEAERIEKGVAPPDPERWNRQMSSVRLWHQLVDDRDYNNASNLLIDDDFRLFIIDNSRAFRLATTLREPEALEHFSRRLLDNLGALDFDQLKKRLGRWLTKEQIRTLLERRDLILARAEELIAARGEAAVLFP